MKLKKLTIDNIASIEHAEIDFNAAPLKNEHLFLITGETGAGKSTIIDCLCLALYGSTPRLESANRESGYDDLNDKEIKANNPKQLLRRGTVSADVTLTFDDNNGIPYVATWHVQRSNKKATKHIMDPQRTLETEDGIEPATCLRNKSDIDKKIIEIIGLNMQEFFRTVVLAQGKFAEFLNSNEKDKGNLLEKMTGTEIYTQIGKKIFEVFRDKENRRNNLLTQLNEITLLNEEQKLTINGQIEELGKQFTAIQRQHEGAQKMTEWLDEKVKNETNLTQKQQDLSKQEEKTQDAAFVEQRQLVADWEASIEARRELRESRLAQRHIAELQEQQPIMQEEFDKLCAALRTTISDVKDKQNRVDEIGIFLKQEAENSAMYESIKTIKSQMKQRQGEQDNIAAFSQALDDERKQLPQVEEQVKFTLEAQRQQEAAVKELQAQYELMQVTSINAKKDAVTKAQNALTLLVTKQDAIGQDTAKIAKLREELATEELNLDKAKAVVETKRNLKEQAHDALEREKDWNALIEQAHTSLHEGDTCPVCGNIITRLQPPKGKDAIDMLKQRLKHAEDDLQATETLIAATAKGIERLEQDIADREKELQRKGTDLSQHWHNTCLLLAQCGKKVDETSDIANAASLATELDSDLQGLNDTLKSADSLLRHITDEQHKLTQLTDAHNKAKIRLNKVNDSIKYQGDAIKRSQSKLEELTNELNSLFSIGDWQEQAARNTDFIGQLEQRATYYQHQVNTAQQLENAIKLTNAIIPAMLENQRNIKGLVDNDTSCDKVPDNLDELWRQFENKNLNWNNQLTNERKTAERARQALDNHLKQLTMKEERLDQIDRYGMSEITSIKQAQQQLVELIAHTKGEIASLKAQQQDIMAKKPDFIEQNRDALAHILADCQERLSELNNQLAEQRALLKKDEDNRAIAGKKQEEYELANAEYQQWQEFNTMLGDSTGNNFRKIAQSYILGELLTNANGYLRQFNNRYTLEPKAGTLTILVRDQMQGDLTSISTLSGGEGFMVSLALALALSNATGKIFSVDTLFIDEGFGSLSENYLDKVMETLNRLYDMGGRRVGIISHVDWLKERVTTQIQVARDEKNNTVSRVTVV